MFKKRTAFAGLIGALLFAAATIVSMRLSAGTQSRMPMEPLHELGQSVQPSFEGWWQEPDGTYRMLVGYLNRNTQETPDVPIGPDNRIDPDGADQGQPTHFLTRRHWGMFTVKVPKDFGDKKLVWTLTVNGQTMSVPMSLNKLWVVDPYHEIGIDNSPPTITFDENGPSKSGPDPLVVTRTAAIGTPLPLTVWVADEAKTQNAARGAAGAGRGAGGGGRGDGRGASPAAGRGAAGAPADPNAAILAAAAAAGIDPDTVAQFLRGGVTVTWSKFRGPGEVTFAANRPNVEKIADGTVPRKAPFNGKAATTATFSEPGDYTLLVVATNGSGEGGGGFLCCWTNGQVHVKVSAK
jgi:hypothetical protein